MVKKAIVIGATGLVGRCVVEQLLAAEHIDQVVSLSRRPIEYESKKHINYLVDYDCLDRYADLFKGDYLFSCLGTTRKQAGSLAAQRKVDVDYQYHAAQLAAQQGLSHYLLVSSSGADTSSHNAYLKMKGELEEKVSNLNFNRVSVFQPSLLLGARKQKRTAEMLGAYLLPLICLLPGLRRYRPIQAEQVARKMIQRSVVGEGVEFFSLDENFISNKP